MELRERLRHLFELHGVPEKTVKDFSGLLEKKKLKITFNGTTKLHHDGKVSEPVKIQGTVVAIGTRYLSVLTKICEVYVKPEETEEDWSMTIRFNSEGVD
jgi:hypothetical protein